MVEIPLAIATVLRICHSCAGLLVSHRQLVCIHSRLC